MGVQRMLVKHPNFVIEASYEDARQWVELGTYMEDSLRMYDEESRSTTGTSTRSWRGSRRSAPSARR